MPTLNATKGAADQNSYVTIAEADAYLDELYLTEDWFQLSDDDKARLLIMATKQIDKMSLLYERFGSVQVRNFPVSIAGVESGYSAAQESAILQAWYLYRNHENIVAAGDEAIQGVKSQNLGAIQIAKSTVGVNPFRKYDQEVFRLLAPYLDIRFSIRRA